LEDARSKALYILRTRRYPGAVPNLIRLISRGNERGRIAAAELLGDLGDPTACEPLRRAAAQDSNGLVKDLARKSLQMLGC
jgi:HEAT repeat protein